MASVTSVEKSGRLVRIYLDGTAAMSVRKKDFERYPISEGEKTDLTLLEDKYTAMQLSDAYEAALNALDRSDRSEKELAKKLEMNGYTSRAAILTVERLKTIGLTDDLKLAKRIVSYETKKGTGRLSIKRKLLMKGISSDVMEKALEGIDHSSQAAGAVKAARKFLAKYSGEDPRRVRGKVTAALARRGYTWDLIQEAWSQVCDSEEES